MLGPPSVDGTEKTGPRLAKIVGSWDGLCKCQFGGGPASLRAQSHHERCDPPGGIAPANELVPPYEMLRTQSPYRLSGVVARPGRRARRPPEPAPSWAPGPAR